MAGLVRGLIIYKIILDILISLCYNNYITREQVIGNAKGTFDLFLHHATGP